MSKILGAALILLVSFTSTRADELPTRVTVIATIHGLHSRSVGYSYEALYALLNKLKPDFVGVEIRQEDLGRDSGYLASMYPKEMIDTAKAYGTRVFGFDWLGDDVAGRPVPSDWWAKGSPIKKLERALDGDPSYKDEQLEAISVDEKALHSSATPAGMNDGRYDLLNDAYYARMAFDYAGTPYELLPRFYAERDFQIAINISAAIKAHPGANIVVLTGADHRSALLKHLQSWFGRKIVLQPVTQQQ